MYAIFAAVSLHTLSLVALHKSLLGTLPLILRDVQNVRNTLPLAAQRLCRKDPRPVA